MHSGQVYPALARALEYWSELPNDTLRDLVGTKPKTEELAVDGELIQIEVSVTWENAKHDAVLVEAVAYGPASWITERVSEKLRIKLSQQSEMMRSDGASRHTSSLSMSLEVQSSSPSGRYKVFVDPWEARNSLWVYSPLIIDAETQDVILKLDDRNWSMDSAEWESDTTVRLGLRRFPGDCSPLGVSVKVDCVSGCAMIGDARFPLNEIDQALDRTWGD